jgi:hypothetical protein
MSSVDVQYDSEYIKCRQTMCSMILSTSNVTKSDWPRTCEVMRGYLNTTSFAEFIGHLIEVGKRAEMVKKMSAFIMEHTACVALIYGLLFGPLM